jgi:hypothetical protein
MKFHHLVQNHLIFTVYDYNHFHYKFECKTCNFNKNALLIEESKNWSNWEIY